MISILDLAVNIAGNVDKLTGDLSKAFGAADKLENKLKSLQGVARSFASNPINIALNRAGGSGGGGVTAGSGMSKLQAEQAAYWNAELRFIRRAEQERINAQRRVYYAARIVQSAIPGAGSGGASGIGNAIGSLVGLSTGSIIAGPIGAAIGLAIDMLIGFAKRVASIVLDILKTVASGVASIIGGVITLAVKTLGSAVDLATSALSGLANMVVSVAATIKDTLVGAVDLLIEKFQEFGTISRNVFLGISGAIAGAGYAFASFEKELIRTAALTQATTSEFALLRDTAIELSKKTIFSATEIARAFGLMGQQGLKVNEILSTMPHVIDLAVTSHMDLAESSRLVVSTMKAFGIEAAHTQQTVDILTKAEIASATTMALLISALSKVGQTARHSGLSLAETSAVLRILSDRLIRGEEAGTALRNILLRIRTPTKEVTKALQELGVNAYDSTGQMKDFATIIDEIAAGAEKLSVQRRNEVLGMLARTRTITALLAIMQAGGNTIRKFTAELEASGGTAHRIAQTQLGALTARIDVLGNKFTAWAATIGEMLAPAFKVVIDLAEKLVDWLAALDPKLVQNVLRWVIIQGAAFGVAYAFTKILNNVMNLLNPFTLLTSTLASIAFYLFQTKIAGANLGEKLVNLQAIIVAFIEKTKPIWMEWVKAILKGIVTVIEMFKRFGEILPALRDMFLIVLEDIKTNFSYLFTKLIPQYLQFFLDSLGKVVEFIRAWAKELFEVFKKEIPNILTDLSFLFNEIFGTLGKLAGKAFFKGLKASLNAWLDSLPFDLKKLFPVTGLIAKLIPSDMGIGKDVSEATKAIGGYNWATGQSTKWNPPKFGGFGQLPEVKFIFSALDGPINRLVGAFNAASAAAGAFVGNIGKKGFQPPALPHQFPEDFSGAEKEFKRFLREQEQSTRSGDPYDTRTNKGAFHARRLLLGFDREEQGEADRARVQAHMQKRRGIGRAIQDVAGKAPKISSLDEFYSNILLAGAGGKGRVDPLLTENQKQTKLLQEIRDKKQAIVGP